jgi:5'-methylthioadenosine phosphorylase
VNYRAMALALQQLDVKACLSTAAVGSLMAEWKPGTLVVCSDFLDYTGRNLTLFDREVVHRDFTEPFGPRSRKAIIETASTLDTAVQPKGVYLGANGPRYETPQEIETYRTLGADLVGMTASSEAILMREAGIDYGCLAIVTNLAAGMSGETLSHQEVVDEMNRSGETAVRILLNASVRAGSPS